MKIKIVPENAAVIESLLLIANGRAQSFTIISYDAIHRLSMQFLSYMVEKGLTKTEMKGAQFCHTPSGPSASGYRFGVHSTSVRLRIGSDAKTVYLIGVARVKIYPKEPARYSYYLRPAAYASWLAKTGSHFNQLKD